MSLRQEGSSRWSAVRPSSSIFRLTWLKERRYVAGVLGRLLRSFPGAHGCQNPNLELSETKKKITKMSQKTLLTRQKRHSGRLGWLVDASRAICEPPSWGNEAGEPGAPGSSSEWSRGESEHGGREGPGRCAVRLRQRSEMSRRWVIKHRRRSPNPRMLVCPNMGHLRAVRNGNYYVTGKAGEWQLNRSLPPQINQLIRWIFVMIQWKVEYNKTEGGTVYGLNCSTGAICCIKAIK